MTPELQLLDPTLAITLPQWAVALLVVGFLFVSIVMILIVLIQRPQGGGLSGAFGAGGGSAGQTAFGARTGDALTIATITIFVLYLLAAIFLNYTIAPPTAAEAPAIVAATDTVEGEADDSTTISEVQPAVEDAQTDTEPATDATTDTTADDITPEGDAPAGSGD